MRIGHIGTSISLNQVVLNQKVIQQEQGNDVVSICADDHWAEEVKARGIRVIDVALARHKPLATLSATKQLWDICRRERFDAIYGGNGIFGSGLIAFGAGTFTNTSDAHTCSATIRRLSVGGNIYMCRHRCNTPANGVIPSNSCRQLAPLP